ncbi:MAG TPA: hypothetical protein PK200_07285 [Spirochaetota bacterium]|nr:hypothetical protein [Spirochaetota bacterium]HQO04001.1 hypothetical protein [Spirochaetota bacterium]HQP48239.1 hypothetical protein [Spirochaetota bacterium]
MNTVDNIEFDKSAFVVSDGFEKNDEREYWLSKTPEERLNAVELMREINYGNTYPRRIQRVLEVA